MHYCEKCGENISDINKPCPTCGMLINRDVSDFNIKEDNKIFNIIIMLIFIVGFGIGGFVFFVLSSEKDGKINFVGSNYSFSYDGGNWIESDLGNEDYYVLQNTNDLNAFLQFPKEATELNLDLDNGDSRDELYVSYSYLLKKDSDYKYHNITSKFMILSNTTNYYITSEFYKYSDTSLKGKLFIVVSPNGKVINVLLKKGSKSISEIEEQVYEILKKIEI